MQSELSPAAFKSWKSGEIVSAPNNSYAEGLATGEGYEYTQMIMREYMDDFVLVSDEEIRNAMKQIVAATRIIPESASSSALAALTRLKNNFRGKKVAMVITGGNSPPDEVNVTLH